MRTLKNATSFTTSRPARRPPLPPGMTAAEVRAAIQAAMSGSPEDEPAYSDDCPKTTAEDWKDAESVAIRFTGRR